MHSLICKLECSLSIATIYKLDFRQSFESSLIFFGGGGRSTELMTLTIAIPEILFNTYLNKRPYCEVKMLRVANSRLWIYVSMRIMLWTMYISFFGLLLKQDYIKMAELPTLKDVFFHTDTDDTRMLILFCCQSCCICMGTHTLNVTTVFNLNH